MRGKNLNTRISEERKNYSKAVIRVSTINQNVGGNRHIVSIDYGLVRAPRPNTGRIERTRKKVGENNGPILSANTGGARKPPGPIIAKLGSSRQLQ